MKKFVHIHERALLKKKKAAKLNITVDELRQLEIEVAAEMNLGVEEIVSC